MIRKAIIVIAWVLFAMPALAEEWGIEVSNDSVAASITGNITYGERQRFIFSKRDCEAVKHMFSTYTTKPANFEKLKGKI